MTEQPIIDVIDSKKNKLHSKYIQALVTVGGIGLVIGFGTWLFHFANPDLAILSSYSYSLGLLVAGIGVYFRNKQ